MKKNFFLCVVSTLILTSIPVLASAQSAREMQLRQKMDSQIGKMSYDEALSKLGKPTQVTDGDKVFVAEWLTEKMPQSAAVNQTTNVGFVRRPRNFLEAYIDAYTERKNKESEYQRSLSHGSKVVFSFDKEKRTLVSWNVMTY